MNRITANYRDTQLKSSGLYEEFSDFGNLVTKISYLVTQQLLMQVRSKHSGSVTRSRTQDASIGSDQQRALSAERLSRHNPSPEILEHIQKARDKLISIVSASRGVHGPTFLVDASEYGQPISCVLKWTNWEELRAQRVYQKIVTMIGHEHFSVPTAAMYDELSGEFQDLNGQHKFLINSENINNSLDKILDFAKKKGCQGDQVLLSSKVRGPTLSDFLATQYSSLSTEQKANFMIQLGGLAMLDLFLGNYDRLFHYVKDKGKVLNYGANLGNVMVDEDNFLKFHLIDNQIEDVDTFSFPKFAKDLMQNKEKALNDLAEDLKESILTSCNMEEVPCIKGEIQSIRDGLHQIQPWLRAGLSQMEQMLRAVICKAWLSMDHYSSIEEKIVAKRAKIFLNQPIQERPFVPRCLQNLQ